MTHKPLASYYGRRNIIRMRVAIPLAALALAPCGCQSPDAAWQQAYNEKRALALQNGQEPARQPVYMAPRPQMARSEPQMASGSPVYVPVPVVDRLNTNSAPTTRRHSADHCHGRGRRDNDCNASRRVNDCLSNGRRSQRNDDGNTGWRHNGCQSVRWSRKRDHDGNKGRRHHDC